MCEFSFHASFKRVYFYAILIVSYCHEKPVICIVSTVILFLYLVISSFFLLIESFVVYLNWLRLSISWHFFSFLKPSTFSIFILYHFLLIHLFNSVFLNLSFNFHDNIFSFPTILALVKYLLLCLMSLCTH